MRRLILIYGWEDKEGTASPLDGLGQHVPATVRYAGTRVFGVGDDGLNALLGSAHGSGLAWMMMQRRAVLGWKRVKGVTVWKDEEQPGLSMIFELEARGVGGVRR